MKESVSHAYPPISHLKADRSQSTATKMCSNKKNKKRWKISLFVVNIKQANQWII